MKHNQASKSSNTKISQSQNDRQAINLKSISDLTLSWKKEAEKMTYEESLQELDELLIALQNESVPVEQLQRSYLRGKVFLERCESLLAKIEQEIVDLNPDTLQDKKSFS